MTQFKSPVYNVKPIPVEKVEANSYNPNSVATPEMKLLETSIWEDGYTQPIVCYFDKEKQKYIIVDGFHRYTILKESKRIFERFSRYWIDEQYCKRNGGIWYGGHLDFKTDWNGRRRTFAVKANNRACIFI